MPEAQKHSCKNAAENAANTLSDSSINVIFDRSAGIMMIRVCYRDYIMEMIPNFMLDQKLAQEAILAFYRNSENRWILPDIDVVRNVQQPESPKRRFSDLHQ
ncbi:MAG TPA: hypothetical protein VLH56_00545 [Dissulfurispiraceae bacterium]|nr:hypothetical protein [Dissulfurispiraceae bacterium]